jgi:hypothetical protein
MSTNQRYSFQIDIENEFIGSKFLKPILENKNSRLNERN